MLNRARRVMWIVIGEDKAAMLARLSSGDTTIPVGRIRREHALVIAESRSGVTDCSRALSGSGTGCVKSHTKRYLLTPMRSLFGNSATETH